MNIQLNLNPENAESLSAMLAALASYGIPLASVTVDGGERVVRKGREMPGEYETLWKEGNPGVSPPRYTEGKQAEFPTKEEFFKSLLDKETALATDAAPIASVPLDEVDDDDI